MMDIEKKLSEVEAAVIADRNGGTAESRTLADKILCTALDVGENMLKCGAEVHRVEDSIIRICRAYGASHVEVFSIPSLIIAAARLEDGAYSSQVRRIYSTGRHLGRLELLNRVSRRLCVEVPSFDEAQSMIKEARNKKVYPSWVAYLGAALTAGALAVLFGGSIRDGIAAAILGIVVQLLDVHRSPRVNQMMHYIICSFVGGLLSMLAYRLGLADDFDKVMIGIIMILVPGLSLDVALRDLLGGDTVSGMIGLLQSVMLAAMLAIGFTCSILLFGGVVWQSI